MIEIGEKDLTLTEAAQILFAGQQVVVSPATLKKCETAFYFLKDFANDKVIYGINTGFGPMAQHKIPYIDRLTLQYNLIRSHSSGSGQPIAPIYAKATLLDRLNTFAQCKSGVHPDLLLILTKMINLDITPVIYEHGGVGASGDLVQLAHVALAIIGEGEVHYEGKIYPAAEIFAKHDITPFAIRIREGIGMMNGTSCMTGIGLVNLIKAKQLLNWSVVISASINEIFEAFDDHIAEPLNAVKRHIGQKKVAAAMRAVLANSILLKNRKEYLYHDVKETHFT